MKFFFILVVLCLASTARSQTVDIQSGTSTEYGGGNTNGGTATFFFPQSADSISLSSQGFSFLTQQPWRGDILGIGDQMLPAALPTDYNPQYGFFSRGVSLKGKTDKGKWTVFAGAAETRNATSFSVAGHPQTPLVMATYERPLNDAWTFSSYNVSTGRQTSIQSLAWKRDKSRCALSLGVGSNARLAAVLCDVKLTKWTIKAGYTLAGANFRPIQLQGMIQTFTENVGFNGTVTYSPTLHETFSVSRENLLAPPVNGIEARATVESASAYKSWGIFNAHVTASEGTDDSSGVTSSGEDLGGGITAMQNKVRATMDFFHSNRGDMETESVTEQIARRLQLMQFVTTENHKTSMNFGGSYTSNSITGAVSYSTVFDPFLPGIPFQQQINVRVTIALGRRLAANMGTYTTPTGQIKYEVSESGYVDGPYRGSSSVGTRSSGGKFEIDGKVVDASGAGVQGAVVKIGDTECITDSTGAFMLHERKNRPAAVDVELTRFMSGLYEIIGAPAIATPGQPVIITVRRAP